eukprot:m.191135 g.191135  ORF g.191135 m.191135 type:complete len:668 (-) comp18245_c0_seq1:20-2023(-)
MGLVRLLAQCWLGMRRIPLLKICLVCIIVYGLLHMHQLAPQPVGGVGRGPRGYEPHHKAAAETQHPTHADADRIPVGRVSEADLNQADHRRHAAILKAREILDRVATRSSTSTTLALEDKLRLMNQTKEQEAMERKNGLERNGFQQYVSDRISMHRSLPDPRSHFCRDLSYDVNLLPKTSVIIVFHNEARSTLLRTVWSVLDRSPARLIHEIILVDDASTFEHLGVPLAAEVPTIPKTRLVRLPERSGLIRAKVAGAETATGEVLTFLDSHCECNTGWLEPLLDRIRQNRTNVVTPTIDSINKDTFAYQAGGDTVTRGVFTWGLTFTWLDLPAEEQHRRSSTALPLPSPTMAGGLFSIDRAYFYHVGTYDLGMNIWGGENLEMSFRIWQCGGRIDIMPCSRVGHVFRDHHPYKFPGGSALATIEHNLNRVAEVWLDEYKELYHERKPHALNIAMGNVSDRIALRNRLGCKSFKWYLDNVFPDMFVPVRENVAGLGALKCQAVGMCLDATTPKAEDMKLRLVPCQSADPSPATGRWALWKQMAQLRVETEFSSRCVDYATHGENKPPGLYPCHGQRGNQEFEYTPLQQIRHVGTGACLTAFKVPGSEGRSREAADGEGREGTMGRGRKGKGPTWIPVMSRCRLGGGNGTTGGAATPLQRWLFTKWHDY